LGFFVPTQTPETDPRLTFFPAKQTLPVIHAEAGIHKPGTNEELMATIHFFPLCNPEDKDNGFSLLDITNDSIGPDSIFPKTHQVLAQRFSESPGIFIRG